MAITKFRYMVCLQVSSKDHCCGKQRHAQKEAKGKQVYTTKLSNPESLRRCASIIRNWAMHFFKTASVYKHFHVIATVPLQILSKRKTKKAAEAATRPTLGALSDWDLLIKAYTGFTKPFSRCANIALYIEKSRLQPEWRTRQWRETPQFSPQSHLLLFNPLNESGDSFFPHALEMLVAPSCTGPCTCLPSRSQQGTLLCSAYRQLDACWKQLQRRERHVGPKAVHKSAAC